MPRNKRREFLLLVVKGAYFDIHLCLVLVRDTLQYEMASAHLNVPLNARLYCVSNSVTAFHKECHYVQYPNVFSLAARIGFTLMQQKLLGFT